MMRTNCLGSLQAALKDAGLEDRYNVSQHHGRAPEAKAASKCDPNGSLQARGAALFPAPPNRYLIGEPLGSPACLRSRIDSLARRRRHLVRQVAKRDGLSLRYGPRSGALTAV